MNSNAGCLPGCVSVLPEMHGAGDAVPLHLAFECPGNLVAADSHRAPQLNLVRVDNTREFGPVEFANLRAGQIVSTLLEGELLFSDAARVLDGDRPPAMRRRRRAGVRLPEGRLHHRL